MPMVAKTGPARHSAGLPGAQPSRTGLATVITPAQCRGARGLLKWSQDELGNMSGVAISTIRNFENEKSHPHRATLAQLVVALENAGVEFIKHDIRGPEASQTLSVPGRVLTSAAIRLIRRR